MAIAEPSEIRRSRATGSPTTLQSWMPAFAGMTKGPVARWGLALTLALAFKAFYSLAPATELQWLLQPVAGLLNLSSALAFVPTPAGEWLDVDHGLVMVKACAGGNFLIASWLGYLWRWRGRPCSPCIALRALGAAWLTTLLANALRILLIAHGQEDLARVTGVSAAEAHRLLGVVVYFGTLALQLAGARATLAAPILYLGIAALLPWLNGVLSGRGGIDASYAAWTAGLPLVTLMAYGVWRFRRRSAHPVGQERRVDPGVRAANPSSR